MADTEYATLSEVKGYLGIPMTTVTDDPEFARLILSASRWIDKYCSRSFLSASYTERRDSVGSWTLMLRHRPVTAVASVMIGDPTVSPVTLVVNRDYFFSESSIEFATPPCRGRGNILAVYTAGYDTLPWDIRQAAIAIVAYRYKEGRRIAQKSVSVGGNETVSFITDAVPKDVQKSLDQWTNPVPL